MARGSSSPTQDYRQQVYHEFNLRVYHYFIASVGLWWILLALVMQGGLLVLAVHLAGQGLSAHTDMAT